MRTELKNAVNLLCDELRKDPEYFYSWQSNIAMAFKDEYDRQVVRPGLSAPVHIIANNAAKNFLTSLIYIHGENPE